MKSIYRIGLAVITILTSAVDVQAQGTCLYCKGTGKMVTNITVSHYGVKSEVKTRCQECGKYTLPSEGHRHIFCKHCGGTGKRGSSSSSSTKNGTSSAGDEYYDLHRDLGLMEIGRQSARTNMYGLPVKEEELKFLIEMYEASTQNCKNYMKWRNELDNGTITCKEGVARNFSYTSIQWLDNDHNARLNRMAALVKTFTIPDGMQTITDRLYNTYMQEYQNYRQFLVTMQTLRKAQDDLDYQQYMRNIFW